MQPFHAVCLRAAGLAVGLAACTAGAAPALAQDEKAVKDVQVIQLKHVRAAEVARVLQEVFQADAKGRIRITADERTNSLLVTATAPLLADVRKLVQVLDAPAADEDRNPRPQIEVIRLRHNEPGGKLEQMLKALLQPPARFVVDPDRKLIFLYAGQPEIERVRALLMHLDSDPVQSLKLRTHVHLFWVVSAADGDKDAGLPDVLKPAAEQLAALGVKRPRLAGQLGAAVVPGTPFDVRGVIELGGPQRLSFKGQLTDTPDGPQLDARVEAGAPAGKAGEAPVSLRTEVRVADSRPTVLGAVPFEGRASAFLVQLTATVQGKEPPKKAAIKLNLNLNGKPWKAVLEWLSDQTGLPVVAAEVPTGVCRIVTKGPVTMDEAFDLINEALSTQNYLLHRRKHSIHLLAADERVDPGRLPMVQLDELDELPRTQIARVIVPFTKGDAREVAAEVRKMLGPFGDVHAVATANQLVLTDTAANLRAIRDTLRQLQAGQKK